MKLVMSPNVDWEPLAIELASDSHTLPSADAIRDFLGKWLLQRENSPVCSNLCRSKFLHVREESGGIEVLVQWVCETCLQKLIKDLSLEFPNIERATVGEPGQPSVPVPTKSRIIDVKARTVTLESGEPVNVEPFRISAEAVSVQDFDAFHRETAYVTVAERVQQLMTYKSNGLLDGYASAGWKSAPSMCLSFEDADAYCRHRHVRLPSDSELLAAITTDDIVRVLTDKERKSVDLTAIPMPPRLTLTGSREGGQFVARRGPWLVKEPGWDRAGRYRRLVGPRDCVGQFFYCEM